MKEKPIKKIYAVNIKQDTKEAADKLTDNFSKLVGELLEKYAKEHTKEENPTLKLLNAKLLSVREKIDSMKNHKQDIEISLPILNVEAVGLLRQIKEYENSKVPSEI